jgi:hypothetical protein
MKATMTLSPLSNVYTGEPGEGVIIKPYVLINIILAGFFAMIIIYSAIFPVEKNYYPVVCIHEKLTGEPCGSCGLSRSLSSITRGRFDEARAYNPNGTRVFMFIAGQVVARVLISAIYIKNVNSRRQLVLMDIMGSSLTFLIAFMPFILSIFKWL